MEMQQGAGPVAPGLRPRSVAPTSLQFVSPGLSLFRIPSDVAQHQQSIECAEVPRLSDACVAQTVDNKKVTTVSRRALRENSCTELEIPH